MAVFVYRARTSDGETVRGEIEAPDRSAAVRLLHADGLHLQSLAPRAATGRGASRRGEAAASGPDRHAPGLAAMVVRVAPATRQAFWREAAQMIDAGFTAGRVLETLARARHGHLSRFAQAHADEVARGRPLSEAMGEEPALFGPLEVGLIRAGEAGGRLDLQADRLAGYFERETELRNQLRWRMLYLKLQLGTLLFTVFALVVLAPVIQAWRMGEELGLAARLWAFAKPLALLGLAAVGLRGVYATAGPARDLVDWLKLHLPSAGAMFRRLSIARVARALGELTGGGLPVAEAMEIAAGTAGNRHLTRKLAAVPTRLRDGEPLSTVLDETREFPFQVIQMVRTGEETGRVDEMLGKVADYYESEAAAATMALATSGFVAMMFLFAGVVLYLAVRFYSGGFGGHFGLINELLEGGGF